MSETAVLEESLSLTPEEESNYSDDPDTLLQTLFTKRNGRPLNAFKHLRHAFPKFNAKPLTHKLDFLKNVSASIAYFRGAEALQSAFSGKKGSYASIQEFGICFDKLASSSSDDLTVRIPAKMLGSYSCAIIVKKESAVSTDVTPST